MFIFHWVSAFFYFCIAAGCGLTLAFAKVSDFQALMLTIACALAVVACAISAHLADKFEKVAAERSMQAQGRFF